MARAAREPDHLTQPGLPQSPRVPTFAVRRAARPVERQGAVRLLQRMYASRGYQAATLPSPVDASSQSFVAIDGSEVLGTLTIDFDGPDGLRVDLLFRDEVDAFRRTGEGVCEFSRLAMDRRARSPRLLAALFHVAYLVAHRCGGVRHLLIEVNPRHVRYYEAMLGFQTVTGPRHHPEIGAPAVMMVLDLTHARRQIEAYGGSPVLTLATRTAYPHFFAADEEQRMIDRLLNRAGQIAEVLDLACGERTAHPGAGEVAH